MEVKMPDDPLNNENSFEKFPGSGTPGEVSQEQLEKANLWEKKMEGVGFAGENQQFGTANETNEYYGETTGMQQEAGEEFNKGISDAAALINYGLDAAARERGVEFVVQTIKGFSGTTVEELFNALGIDTPKEYEDTRDEAMAARTNVAEFREGVNAPTQRRSPEGFMRAIADMKELIGEVEGADPRYGELRAGARAAGKGYFEYAVSQYGKRGLTELFKTLAEQREKAEVKDEIEDDEFDDEPSVIDFPGKPEETNGPEKIETNPEEARRKKEELLNREGLNSEIVKKDAA